MKTTRAKISPRIIVGTLIAMMMAACTLGSSGGNGNFSFLDPTPSLELDINDKVDRPLAAGALLKLEIRDGGELVAIDNAATNDSAVLEVVDTGDGVVVVRGVGAGRTELTVTDLSGREDFITLNVAEPTNTEIVVLPWDRLLPLPDRLFTDGIALLPDSPLEVFALYTDSDGDALTGFGVHDWSLSDGTEATVSPKDSSDFATLRSGVAPQTYTLSRGDAASIDLETITEDQIERLEIYSHTDDAGPVAPGTALEIEAGRFHIMHVAAYLTDGRYIVGGGSTPLDVTAAEDAVGVLEIQETPATLAANPDDEDLARILANGRAFTLNTQNTGSTTVTVDWLGKTTTFDITVVAPE